LEFFRFWKSLFYVLVDVTRSCVVGFDEFKVVANTKPVFEEKGRATALDFAFCHDAYSIA
jgi:hypothetical protein